MSKTSKTSLSGLGRVKRDWSEPKSSQQSDVELIEWSPTPPKVLTGAEKRLKDIEDAIAGRPVLSERVPSNSSAQFTNKRPAPTDLPPAKKARQLPRGTNTKEVTIASLSSSTWSSNSSSSKPASKSASAPRSKPPKVAPVFLSQEQTHILKLVQEGSSVFYTGSAGENDIQYQNYHSGLNIVTRQGTGKSVLLREIIKTLHKQHVKSPDAIAITASTGRYSFFFALLTHIFILRLRYRSV